jgi:hypothetical protein
MITCKDCGAQQPDGTLFCDDCGCYLVEMGTRTTVILPFSDFAYRTPPPPIPDFRPASLNQPITITFIIPSSRRRLELKLIDQIRVGRADEPLNELLELNLAADDGADLGVSRSHALIQPASEGLVIIDLKSTNGTLLNNSPLSPKIPYPIKNGDELRFGDLLVHILF